jgi:hypothetical protein
MHTTIATHNYGRNWLHHIIWTAGRKVLLGPKEKSKETCWRPVARTVLVMWWYWW